jgi:hypothetical protein
MQPESPDSSPSPDEASVQRRIFLVRLAAWGTVLLLAVVAFNVRAGRSDAEHGANGPQVNGRTSQGLPIWAVTEDGRIREIRMVWRFECDNDGELGAFGLTLRDSVDGFERRDGGWTYDEDDDLPTSDHGWVAHIAVSANGRAAPDETHSGESSAVMSFTRGATKGATCHSGPVNWWVGRG